MQISRAGRAALAAAVIGGTSVDAMAVAVYTQSDLLGPGSSVHLVAYVHQELHRPPRALAIGSLGTGQQSGQWEFDLTDPIEHYAVIGRDSAGGVFVSLNNPAIGNGVSFENAFPGFNEAEVADALLTGGPLVQAFVTRLETIPGAVTPIGIECRTTHFSVGADYGAFHASLAPIPEPTAIATIFVGAGLLLTRRRSAV